MKANFKYIYIVVFFSLSVMFSSCEDKLKDAFYDPEKQTNPSFEMLFAGALQPTELFRLEYGPAYHNNRVFNKLLGMGLYPGDASGYNTYPEDGFNLSAYGSTGNVRNTVFTKTYVDFNKNIPVMNLLLNGMSEEDKKNYAIYVWCANIVKAYMFQRLTDVYDDVPFSEAGKAFENIFLAKYDSQHDIYHTLLDTLKNISARLKGYKLNNSYAHQNFTTYDILNNGDVSKWEKFANSLRLRMAIRLSIIEPETSKQVIADIIQNNSPLVSEAADFIGMAEKDLAHEFEFYWPRGFSETFYHCHAPYFMLHDVFGYNGTSTPADQVDPRLYVIFQPSVFGQYVGLKEWGPDHNAYIWQIFPTTSRQDSAINYDYDEHINPFFSMYNKVTYNNFNMKYPSFTSTETHLLLAEAKLRFPDVTGTIDPVTEYTQAISQSIDWWYETNNTNDFGVATSPAIPANIMPGSKYPKPSSVVINAFLNNKSNAFNLMTSSDKIKEIFYQKYTHLNLFNFWEVWSEARRLQKDYGILVPRSKAMRWMERLAYPASEATTNPDNYQKVAGQDNFTTPVWWTGRK
jgi:hypothetical protein